MLKICGLNLRKIANDLRLMNSGPTTSIHEIDLPAIQAGSSIMPKKLIQLELSLSCKLHIKYLVMI